MLRVLSFSSLFPLNYLIIFAAFNFHICSLPCWIRGLEIIYIHAFRKPGSPMLDHLNCLSGLFLVQIHNFLFVLFRFVVGWTLKSVNSTSLILWVEILSRIPTKFPYLYLKSIFHCNFSFCPHLTCWLILGILFLLDSSVFSFFVFKNASTLSRSIHYLIFLFLD